MTAAAAAPLDTSVPRIERRQWWLCSSGIIVTVLLTVGIISFALPVLNPGAGWYFPVDPSLAIHALLGLVLLFDGRCPATKQECWNEPTQDADSVTEMLGDLEPQIPNCLARWAGHCWP